MAVLCPADDFDGSGVSCAGVIDFVSASFGDDGVSKTHHFGITFSAGHATQVVEVTSGIEPAGVRLDDEWGRGKRAGDDC